MNLSEISTIKENAVKADDSMLIIVKGQIIPSHKGKHSHLCARITHRIQELENSTKLALT